MAVLITGLGVGETERLKKCDTVFTRFFSQFDAGFGDFEIKINLIKKILMKKAEISTPMIFICTGFIEYFE